MIRRIIPKKARRIIWAILLRVKTLSTILFTGNITDRVKFIKDIFVYKQRCRQVGDNRFKLKTGRMYPQLTCHRGKSGIKDVHYFYQDLIVAKKIYESGVREHVDIGSRIDGFVAHIATFLDRVTVIDVRPNVPQIFNIEFIQQDAKYLSDIIDNSVSSISSLHAVEHFGLGRYGDDIDPIADIKAINAIVRVLKPGGMAYFSVPIGKERLEYNAHRIYSPLSVIKQFTSGGGYCCRSLL